MEKLTFAHLHETLQLRQTECYTDQPTPDFDYAVGAAGCVGEILKNMRKDYIEGERIRDATVAEEIADAVIFLDLLAHSMNFNLEHLITTKFDADAIDLGSSHLLNLAAPTHDDEE